MDMSSSFFQSSRLSPWACKNIVFPRLAARIVPSPPSASLTMNSSLDQALSAEVSGKSENTPLAPSATISRVGVSRIWINSSTSMVRTKDCHVLFPQYGPSLYVGYRSGPIWPTP